MADTLYYVHDPMCSWCYGFGPALDSFLARLPADIVVVRLLGGLAHDSDEPMPPEMRQRLQQTWHRIQHRIPGTLFNFRFWSDCEPRRSTYPACRAVIAARRQHPSFDDAMTRAIQRAYYREARNPSDRETLIALAGEIGADPNAFADTLDSPENRAALEDDIRRAREMGADSFPSLVLELDGSRWSVQVDYTDAHRMLETIREIRERN